MSRVNWCVVGGCLLVCLSSVIDLDAQEKTKKRPLPRIALRTAYLAEPVGDAHQILIAGELGGEAKLTLDGNTCTITQFGDTGVCTKIAFPPIDVRLVQLRLADPTGAGRRLFKVEGEFDDDIRYTLVVPRRRSQPHRLVVDMGNDRRRTITLEAVQRPAGGRPELGKNAKYRAVQADGVVTVYATSETPTSGYKVRLEQLPIEIFPPQYRLVWVTPSGIVQQVVTPIEVQRTFKSEADVKEVIVHDERGRHKIPVKQDE